ncbi:MAG TPA: 7-cyano-7-deazaguanine synthase QueC [Elusimicrobia bacterium]|nr:7-cyano-7-deazaguanine synthase QueC [Elusimicrobiota bacterium]HBT61088.1 7-cyano-7-deazaguanine synthase QueC [Elusimicrobiota bacterium]
MARKAVVLLSGGLDSATALYWAKSQGYEVTALTVRYGQRHVREIAAARAISRRAGVSRMEVSLSLPWLKSSSLVDRKQELPAQAPGRIGKGPIPTTYVPGRNTVFLSLAVSLADAQGARAVVIGSNCQDYSGYPDCRPDFTRAFGTVARLGTRRGAQGRPICVLAPLERLDKKGIVRLAARLHVPLELTWSCYRGGLRPCGRCDSCLLRARGFKAAGRADPALERSP